VLLTITAEQRNVLYQTIPSGLVDRRCLAGGLRKDFDAASRLGIACSDDLRW